MGQSSILNLLPGIISPKHPHSTLTVIGPPICIDSLTSYPLKNGWHSSRVIIFFFNVGLQGSLPGHHSNHWRAGHRGFRSWENRNPVPAVDAASASSEILVYSSHTSSELPSFMTVLTFDPFTHDAGTFGSVLSRVVQNFGDQQHR